MKDELALEIGRHVLKAFDDFYKQKLCVKNFIVPISLPYTSDMPSAPIMACQFEMPTFAIRNRKMEIEIISMAEYYGWDTGLKTEGRGEGVE